MRWNFFNDSTADSIYSNLQVKYLFKLFKLKTNSEPKIRLKTN